MYKKLKHDLEDLGVSIEDVAVLLGVHRNTMSNKFNGKSKFFVDELCVIRDKWFPTETLDELCANVA